MNGNLEIRKAKMTKTEKKQNRISKGCGTASKYSICVMGLTEEEREKGSEEIFETIMTETFPKLMSDTKSQFQEAQRTHAGLMPKPYT